MSVGIETSLRGVARTLTERIAPAIADPFAGEAARLAAIMLAICANAVDDAAALRVDENDRLRALFADAASQVAEPFAAALREAAGSRDQDLRISALDRVNARLRRLLVELHAAVEAMPGEPARSIDRRIWQTLAGIEAARAPRV